MKKFRWLFSLEFNDINIDHLPVDLGVQPFSLAKDPLFLKNGFSTKIDCLPEYDTDLKQFYSILAECYDFTGEKGVCLAQEQIEEKLASSAAKLFLYDQDDMVVEQWEITGMWPKSLMFGDDYGDAPSVEIEWMFNQAEMTYHFNPEDKMQTVEFYRGIRGNQNNDKIDDILKWSNGALEMGHDEIQWMFPSNEVSMMNAHAPVMTKEESEIFQNDPELLKKTKEVFVRYLNFLELKLVQDEWLPGEAAYVVIEPIGTLPRWMKRFNHNMLRVTRMMKSLRLTGNSQYANALFVCLKSIAANPDNEQYALSENTWNYWHGAVFEPLWKE